MAIGSNSLVLTQDLRADAQDYRRDSNNKHKWELGETFGLGQARLHPKPRKPAAKGRVHKFHAYKSANHGGPVPDRDDIVTDSSADEEVEPQDMAPAPEVDAEVTYSFDAQRGPSQGSQVLGYALEKAVAKFESNATEKLVRDEYEILGQDGEPLPTKAGKKAQKSAEISVEEDDYEFI